MVDILKIHLTFLASKSFNGNCLENFNDFRFCFFQYQQKFREN